MAAPSSVEMAASRPSSAVSSPPLRTTTSRSRTQSLSSDRPSTIGYGLMSPPLSISPEAAFIAASAASQIVTNDHDSHADTWYDQHGIAPSSETAMVSPGALQLVNSFIDQLLFNFLSVSRSTVLSTLRPAVSEVLKPKLAKDAINQADDELREYLGGGDDVEDTTLSQEAVNSNDWDLELVWKRTRLRCMVYSSLGDLEEEDEDYFMEQEYLNAGPDDRLSDPVSPAVAIFLTSILEFMGEQALVVAGQAAYHRMRVKFEKDLKDGSRSPNDMADRIVVEDTDMERVALDRTLGRLWRTWKKKIRSPVGIDHILPRSYSRDSFHGSHLRPASMGAEAMVPTTVPEPANELLDQEPPTEPPTGASRDASDGILDEYQLAISIPLPIGPRDVDEIEVPGLAAYKQDEEEHKDPEHERPPRPKSLMIPVRLPAADVVTATASSPQLCAPGLAARKRSNSLPTPTATPYSSSWMTKRTNSESSRSMDEAHGPDSALHGSVDQWAQPGHEGFTAAADAHVSAPAAASEGSTRSAGLDAAVQKSEDEGEEDAEDGDMDDLDDFIEEPQIMTSSRISISGRSSSPSASERGKSLSINVGLPARPSSVHSLRLIEVASPRSPIPMSRGNSVDAADSRRAASVSRTNSVRTPPIFEEPGLADLSAAPRSLNGPPHNRLSTLAPQAISEVEERMTRSYDDVSPMAPEDMATEYSLATPSPAEDSDRFDPPRQPPLDAHALHGSTQAARKRDTTDETGDLPISTISNSLNKRLPDPAGRKLAHIREDMALTAVNVPAPSPPTVPERSPSRQFAPVANTQPNTVLASADRLRTRTTSDVSLSPSSHPSGSPVIPARKRAIRASEDNTPAHVDVARNFEELIQSNQTIQYTLTPESMRDMNHARSFGSPGPIAPHKPRRSDDVLQPDERVRTSVTQKSQSPMRRSGSVSQPIGPSAQVALQSQRNSLKPLATGPRGPVPQARDARMHRESLNDLADFFRSTGPTGPPETSPAAHSGPTSSAARSGQPNSLRSAHSPPSMHNNDSESIRTSTTSNSGRIRLQARNAAVDYKDDNSDLIDFIRRGPPSASGGHRIPRNVAPFRTTMDSDQMTAAVGGRAVDAQLQDIDARMSQASTNMTESSANSQSALLGRNRGGMSGNSRFGGVDTDDMPMPQRKTRRVRDPYAIDLSDEDEAEWADQAPKPQARKASNEESLADFLRNYQPPPEPKLQPVSQNIPKKKASATSLMARFGRRDNSHAGSSSSKTNTGAKTAGKPAPAATSPNIQAGGGRGYIPLQVHIPTGPESYGTSSAYGATGPPRPAPAPAGSANASSGRRVPMKRYEPREATSVSSRGTSDLAAFLKDSGPPPGISPSAQYSSPAADEDDGNLSKVFGRRKRPSFA